MIPEKILKILKIIANSPNEDTIIDLEDTGEDILEKNTSKNKEENKFFFKKINSEEKLETPYTKKSEIIEFHHKDSPKIKFYMFQYEKTYSIFVLIEKKLYDLNIKDSYIPEKSQKPIFPEKNSLIFPQDLIRHTTQTDFFQEFIEEYKERIKKTIIEKSKEKNINYFGIDFFIPKNIPKRSYFLETRFKGCYHITLYKDFKKDNLTKDLLKTKIIKTISKEILLTTEFSNLRKIPKNYHEFIAICKKIDEEVLEIKEKLLQFQNL